MGAGKATLCSRPLKCELRIDHVARPLHIMLAEKRGGFGLIQYVSNSIKLRESPGGVCLSHNLS